MNHRVTRVDNLMYAGCEPHWKCNICGKCIPFHCYSKEQIEAQECISADEYFFIEWLIVEKNMSKAQFEALSTLQLSSLRDEWSKWYSKLK